MKKSPRSHTKFNRTTLLLIGFILSIAVFTMVSWRTDAQNKSVGPPRGEIKENPAGGIQIAPVKAPDNGQGEAPEVIAVEIEPNGTSGTATALPAFDPLAVVHASINPGGDLDFYTFTAPAGSRVWIETDTGGTQNAGATSRDTVIDLLAADGTTVIENDDDDGTGNGGDGTIETGLASIIAGRTLTAGGTYFIRVQGFSATGIINPYRILVTVTNTAATPEVEANDTAATANVINTGLRSGSIGVAADVDYYSISVPAGRTVFFNTDADPERDGTGTDLVVEFRDPADALLLTVDSSITGDLTDPAAEGANFFVSTAGTYFIKVRHFLATGTGTYDLNVAVSGTPAVNNIIISEFRVRGPSGANDEFVEVFNRSLSSHTVASAVGSGYGVAASDGVTRCTIPNGTVIPGGGHFLCTNSVAYSLGGYATGDATFATDIPDNAGIALFNNNVPANYTLANRLDAIGSTSEANTLYKEGTGYPALTPFSIDYSFYRLHSGGSSSVTGNVFPNTSFAQDSDNNAADMVFVDTNGTSAGAGQRLGAPGPENLASPLVHITGFTRSLPDTCVTAGLPPNAIRDLTSVPAQNSTFGTVEIRRAFTNATGGNITRLRFRVVKLTTFPAPSGTCDLRPRTTADTTDNFSNLPCGTGTSVITVLGTTLEQPPSQPNGGGWGSTFSVGTVTLGTPIPPGNTVIVRFLFGVQQTGGGVIGPPAIPGISGSMAIEALPRGGGLWNFKSQSDSPLNIIDINAPTAAQVSIGGRVLTADGRGLTNARVTITGPDGVARTTLTSSFGYYSFDGVESGATYVVSVGSKRYIFTPRSVQVVDSVGDLDFVAEP